jgi:hypothetical protein
MKNISNLLSVLVISLLFYLGSLLWVFFQNNTFSKTFGESAQFKKYMKKEHLMSCAVRNIAII